ncbi:hypothetical protein [Aquimarina rubra]
MEELYIDLKSRYGQAEINLINLETIEVYFSKAKEPVIIQKGSESGYFMVSYPKLTSEHNGIKEEYTTSPKVLFEGLLWILKKVNRDGKVLPEI